MTALKQAIKALYLTVFEEDPTNEAEDWFNDFGESHVPVAKTSETISDFQDSGWKITGEAPALHDCTAYNLRRGKTSLTVIDAGQFRLAYRG